MTGHFSFTWTTGLFYFLSFLEGRSKTHYISVHVLPRAAAFSSGNEAIFLKLTSFPVSPPMLLKSPSLL